MVKYGSPSGRRPTYLMSQRPSLQKRGPQCRPPGRSAGFRSSVPALCGALTSGFHQTEWGLHLTFPQARRGGRTVYSFNCVVTASMPVIHRPARGPARGVVLRRGGVGAHQGAVVHITEGFGAAGFRGTGSAANFTPMNLSSANGIGCTAGGCCLA